MATSRAQQRFFGMVRATQKGEMENPSPEITKVASTVSKSDVKKMASTKHKGLPEKVPANEGVINDSGNFVGASDEKLKKDIADITYGIDVVKALKPRKYKMKDTDKEQVGFIAQEVEAHVPEVITTGTNPKGVEQKGLSYGQLTSVLTKALQEAVAKIETLEAKVTALENA